MDRTHWTPELTQFFLNALVDECRAGNRPNTTLNRIGKDNVLKRLQDFTGRPWKWDPCKHNWDEFKKKWACWRRLIKLSGVTFHPKTKLINMPQEWWDQQIQVKTSSPPLQPCSIFFPLTTSLLCSSCRQIRLQNNLCIQGLNTRNY